MAEAALKSSKYAKKKSKNKDDKTQTFIWEGANKQGAKVKGELLASNPALAKAQLRKQGIIPGKIRKKTVNPLTSGKKAIKGGDIAVFVRQLAVMMKSGVPLVQAFEIIGRGHENPSIQDLVMQIRSDVESGTSFAQALRKHPRHFDDLFCDLVDAGEQSGSLDQMLDRIATYKEKSEALKSKIKKAMFYPMAVLTVAVGVTVVLLVYVIPMFEDLFASVGGDLPAFTKMVVNLSQNLRDFWYIYLGVTIGTIFSYKQANQRSAAFRAGKDKFLLKLPVVGALINKAAVARFARTLSTTFAAGVPLVNALESAAGASGNYVHKTAILQIRDDVTTGMQMNLAMQSTGVFPNMVNQMVAIGEEAGSLDDMLAKIADIFEGEVDDAVDGLSSLIEPFIIVFLGTVVGGLVVAMYLPIFSLGEAF